MANTELHALLCNMNYMVVFSNERIQCGGELRHNNKVAIGVSAIPARYLLWFCCMCASISLSLFSLDFSPLHRKRPPCRQLLITRTPTLTQVSSPLQRRFKLMPMPKHSAMSPSLPLTATSHLLPLTTTLVSACLQKLWALPFRLIPHYSKLSKSSMTCGEARYD